MFFWIICTQKIPISFSLLIAPPPSLTIIGRNRFGTSYFLCILGYLKFSIYLNLFSLKKITDLYLHVKKGLSSWEKCIRNVPFLFLIKVVKLARLKLVLINNLVSLDLLRKKVPDCFSCKQLKTVNILSEPWAIISIFDKKTYLNFLSLTCKGFWNLCVA